MGDFAEGNVVFELGDVISKWEVLCDKGGCEPCDGLVLDINVDERVLKWTARVYHSLIVVGTVSIP